MAKTPLRMLAVVLGLLVVGNLWSQTGSQPAYLNPALPIGQRVDGPDGDEVVEVYLTPPQIPVRPFAPCAVSSVSTCGRVKAGIFRSR
jgi:hypothetical protein